MPITRGLLLIIVLSLLPLNAVAQDTDELEAAFENVLGRLEARDLDGFLKLWHPEAVLFVRDTPFPVDCVEAGKEVWREIFEDFFSANNRTDVVPVDVEYRVIGDTGLVWGHTQTIVEPKDAPRIVEYSRLTAVFVKTDAGWLVVNWHGSPRVDRVTR
jgi:uncharacterized protein (TIGR02246 family)